MSANDDRRSEPLLAYWESQWRRNAELEDQRLQVTNFVVAASVVAIGAAAVSPPTERWLLIVVGLAVAGANVMALAYSRRSAQWARVHKQRARLVLKENWPYLFDLQERAYHVKLGKGRDSPLPNAGHSPFRREMIQRGIHALLAVLAILIGLFAPLAKTESSPTPAPATTTSEPG